MKDMNRQKLNKQKVNDPPLYKEKYENPFFIAKYVSLWAYGYKNGIGHSEGLYRTINELSFNSLEQAGSHKILDVGCGVGRTSADLARFFKMSDVTGIDSAPMMIEMARRLHSFGDQIIFDMGKLGFGKLHITREELPNLKFDQINLENFCTENGKSAFDLITAVNFIDRVKNIRQSLESILNLLKNDGVLILCTPLNFSNVHDWRQYGSYESFQKLVRGIGFFIELAFDGLVYKEIIDARGATEEYPTIVIKLRKIK